MDEIYEMLKQKLDKMREMKDTKIVLDFAEIAKLYQMACYMKQIQNIANGME